MSEHWLFTCTPDNFESLKEDNFASFGFPPKSLKLAVGVKTGDKCVIYISKRQKLGVICQITSDPYPEDDKEYPLRVDMQPELILADEKLLDVKKLVPQLAFITAKQKATSWGVAFQLTLRKISEENFQLIESEMRKETAKPPPKKSSHGEVVEIMGNIGKCLGKFVDYEWKVQGTEYRHDVVWKEKEFLTPFVVIEVCDSGSLAKDILALDWASKNLKATATLVVVKDSDFDQAERRSPPQSQIIVVKAESMKILGELIQIQGNLELLRAVFQ